MVEQTYGLRVEAKYGITVKTNAVFCAMSCVLNKGNFIFTGDSSGFLFQLHGSIKSEIYNTKISSNLTNPKAGIFLINSADAYFRNVTSTDRTGKSYAIKAMNSKITVKDCNFSCKTDGTLRAGFDIILDPLYADYSFPDNYKTEIYLKNTKGNTSHIVNKKIKNMIIYEK
jgi:hypothetical protein